MGELKDKLMMNKQNGWNDADGKKREEIYVFCDKYIDFLNKCKTEREAVSYSVKAAREAGFKDVSEYTELKPNDKVYFINRDKSMYLAVIGKEKLEDGLNVIGSHIDSPRIDLKPNPLYEADEMALFKTHYYGGIKKYQWTCIPLAIHGVVIKQDGEKVLINIGECEDDMVFTITDLLPHLAAKQMDKKLKEVIEGEDLNLLIGSIPLKEEENNKVKLHILKILNDKYGIIEEDFLSAELEIVPAFKSKSLGFDRSMVAGYGQDDKVCAFTSLVSILELNNPEKTAVCMLTDKEEVGSMGNTGMESEMFDVFIAKLLDLKNENRPNAINYAYSKSRMLSADVDAAYDPNYPSVSEKQNAAFFGYGMGINKYTGARGKSGSSDANPEYIASLRKLFNENNVRYQFCELGKVDEGGGGTIAYILANKGMEVIDCGTPVLCMHSPYEITSKFDVYETYRAYKVFYNN